MTTKGPQEMTVRARHGVLADLASRRTHFVPDSSSAEWYGLSANGSRAQTHVDHIMDRQVDFAAC